MTAPHRPVRLIAMVAASGLVAALLVYAGHSEARAHAPVPSTPAASRAETAPASTSFARIGIGACADSKTDKVEPVVTAATVDSCSTPVARDTDLASLSVDETRSAGELSSYP
jgi:hypothetical protein